MWDMMAAKNLEDQMSSEQKHLIDLYCEMIPEQRYQIPALSEMTPEERYHLSLEELTLAVVKDQQKSASSDESPLVRDSPVDGVSEIGPAASSANPEQRRVALEETHTTQPNLKLDIRTMDGSAWLLEVQHGSAVLDAKAEIARIREIPHQCIKLIKDTNVLDDDVVFEAQDEGIICLAMVVSAENIYHQLEQSVEQRSIVSALESLPQVVGKNDERAITLVAAKMNDRLPLVRQKAVIAFSQIVEIGSDAAVCEIVDLMNDSHWKVRRSAAQVIAKVAENGNEIATEACIALLQDGEQEVRCATLEALAEIAKKGNEHVCAIVVNQSNNDPDPRVRRAARNVISKIAAKCDRDTGRENQLVDLVWGVQI